MAVNINISVMSVIILVLCSGCNSNALTGNTADNTTNQIPIQTLASDGFFSEQECQLRGLQNKVIMLESKYCGHCKITLPVFQEACREKGIEPLVLDVSVPEQRKQMESYGIQIAYTPTFAFGCNYYISARQKGDYMEMLDKFLEEVEK